MAFTPLVSSQTVTGETVSSGTQRIVNGGIANNNSACLNGIQIISSGGTANSTILYWAGTQSVSSGGIANSTTISNGGSQCVFSGGIANVINQQGGGTIITDTGATITGGINARSDGHSAFSIANGIASNFLLESGGRLTVLSGHSAIDTLISSGGSQNVSSRGVANSTTIDYGGWQSISSGGIANYTIIKCDGSQCVSAGGVANSTTINMWGCQYVLSGGTASVINQLSSAAIITDTGATITGGINARTDGHSAFSIVNGIASNFLLENFGQLTVLSGNSAIDTVVAYWGSQYVSSGGTANSTNISGGIQTVFSGGTANSTAINYSGTQTVSSGGTANSTTVSGGGHQNVSGVANFTSIAGGCQNIFSGGVATSGTINFGSQIISSGGTANSTTINSYGSQIIASGGTGSNTTINSQGMLYAQSGGIAKVINQQAGAAIIADTGATITGGVNTRTGGHSAFSIVSGTASNFLLESSGSLSILSGNSAINTVVGYWGNQYVFSGGTANSTTINYAGNQYISSGGVANSTTISSGGSQTISSGGIANTINQQAGATIIAYTGATITGGINTRIDGHSAFSIVNGVASNFLLENDGLLTVLSGHSAIDTVISFLGWEIVSSGGTAISTAINYNGSQYVSSGGVANSTTVADGGWQWVYSGGAANATIVAAGGWQSVSSGGAANYTTINSGGSQIINYGCTANVINQQSGATIVAYTGATITDGVNARTDGHNAFSIVNGVASNFLLENGGQLNVLSGHSAIDTLIGSRGYQYVSSGGVANSTTINSGGTQYVSWIDNSTAINSGGQQKIWSKGVANSTTINLGGQQYVSYGGIASDAKISAGGWQYISSGGTANTTIINFSGRQWVSSGGVANSTGINSDGYQYVGGMASQSMIQSGGMLMIGEGGNAVDFAISSGGILGWSFNAIFSGTSDGFAIVSSSGKTSYNLYLMSGVAQYVSSGYMATGATINDGGLQRVSSGGIVSSAVINSGGSQYVSSGGVANSVIINSCGSQLVYGSANEINQQKGGTIIADTKAIITGGVNARADGHSAFAIVNGAASNFLLENGGKLTVLSGHSAVDTVIGFRGSQIVSSGGIANLTAVNSGGSMLVSSGGIVSGALTTAGGHIVLANAASVSSLVTLSYVLTSAVTNDVLVTVNGGTLGTGVTAYSLNLDNTATGNYILADGVNLTGMNGKTLSVTDNGQNVNVQVGASYTFIDGDKLTLNFTDSTRDQLTAVFIVGGTVPAFTPIVSSQTVTGETVGSGTQSIINSGIANSTTISDSGYQNISSGGAANFTTINSGGAQSISSGGVASNTINNNGDQYVFSGGTANTTTINNSGYQTVYYGGTANNTTLNFAAGQYVSGIANSTTVNSCGYQMISDMGVANSTTVNFYGDQVISSGGTANISIINSGGWQEIRSGGVANSATIGGYQYVSSSGTANNVIVNSGGYMNVYSGGIVSGTLTVAGGHVVLDDAASFSGLATLSYVMATADTDDVLVTVNGGTLGTGATAYSLNLDNTAAGSYILADGVDLSGMSSQTFSVTDNIETVDLTVGSNYTFSNGDMLSLNFTDSVRDQLTAVFTVGLPMTFTPIVSSRTVTGETVASGTQSIVNNGIANSTTINDSGYQNVSSGGVTNFTTINSGGDQYVSSGGVANFTTINDSCWQDVCFGGVANSGTVNCGGYQDVYSGGVANFTTINSGGELSVYGGSANVINQQSGGAIWAYTDATITGGTNTRTDGHSAFSIVNGVASNFLLENYGQLTVLSGHSAIDTMIASGGCQEVLSGGVTNNTIVNSGGGMGVLFGGIVSGTLTIAGGDVGLDNATSVSGLATISYVLSTANTNEALVTVNGGTLGTGITAYSLNLDNTATGNYILADGFDLTGMNGKTFSVTDDSQIIDLTVGSSYTFSNGDSLSLSFTDSVYDQLTATFTVSGTVLPFTPIVSSRTVTGETVSSGTQSVVNGGIANSGAINDSGYQNISSGGAANSTTINSGGEQDVFSGGVANFTTINDSGYQYVYSGGMASNTTINYYGEQEVYSGGAANLTTINSGGWQGVLGGAANFTTINSGGWQDVLSGGVTGNTTINYYGDQEVYSGGVANFTTINSCCWQNIWSGGVANNTTINSIGWQIVFGGTASGTILSSGGQQYASAGGVANNTVINLDCYQIVYSGGSANSAAVNSGGYQDVYTGGTANNTIINSGGGQFVDGVANFTTINSDGYQVVDAAANNTAINSGGSQIISSGGMASNTTVSLNGRQDVYSGGSANNTAINSGLQMVYGTANSTTINNWGHQDVHSGGVANSTTINSGGYQVVEATANNTTINFGGEQDVWSGGMASNTTVSFNGWQYVYSGAAANNTAINGGLQMVYGTANSTTINNWGYQDVHSGGVANSTTINSGGNQNVCSGGVVNSTTINSGGSQLVSSGGVTSDTIVNSGGNMYVVSGGIVSGALTEAGGHVVLDDAASVCNLMALSYVLTTAKTNDALVTVNGGTLGRCITAYSLNLNNTATGSYILATGADLSGMNGRIFSVTANGQSVNVQVGSSYVFSDKHMLSLNLTDAATDQLTATFILDTTPPSTPAGLSRTITGNSVAFDWNDSTDAGSGVKQYEIQVDNNSNFSSPEYSASPAVSDATVNSLADGAYYWKVRTQDNAGNYSAWSAGSSFVVDTITPSVPAALTQTVTGKNVALDWSDSTDAGSGVKQYEVLVDNNADFSSPEYSASPTASAATVNSLADGAYYWEVRVQDKAGNYSAWSAGSNFVVDTVAPSAPAALTQTVTGNSVALDWSDSSDATSGVKNYLLQYAANDQFTGAVQRTISTSDANVFGLSDGIYYWRVQAVDNSGNASAWVAGNFTVDATAPSVPINLTQTAAGKNVALDWDDASDATSGVKQYQVQIDYNSYFNSPVSTQTVAASAATANGLAEGNYYWRVRTQDNSGNYSAWSSASSFIVDSIAPSVPSALTQTVTGKNVAFDWSDSSDSGSGLKNYLIEYALNGQFTGAVPYSTTVSNTNISSMADGNYSWRVQAVDNSGNAGNWITGDNFTVDTVKPTVPDGLTNTSNGKTVALDWNDATDATSGIKQYEVEVDSDSKFFSLEYFKRVTLSQVSVENLTAGTYYWRVRTQDNSGNYSAWSATANLVLDSTPPIVPTGLKQTITGNTVAFDWADSTDASGIKQYEIRADNNSDFSSPEYSAQVAASQASGNLAAGTYYWQVRAQDNGNNWSAWSKSSSFMVTPVDTAANDYKTAKDINAGVDNWVGVGDAADVYKLTMANAGTLTLGLTGLSGNADLSLLSSTGAVLKSSAQTGTADEAINSAALLAGTYYVKIAAGKGVNDAAYTLTNTENYFPTDTAANDYKTAKDIGSGVDNWVGFGDAADVYKLTMTSAGSLTLGLTGLSGNANLSLLSSTGAVLKTTATGIANESIAQNLLAGTYYVKVAAGAGVTAAAYTLTDQISYYSGDTLDKAGNTIAAAKLVDASLPTQTGWVGFGDSDDYYRFDVATATQGTLRLDMTGGNADLSLYDKNGRLLQKSARTGTLEDVITGNLAVGTYYARVNAVSGNNSIDYTLEFSKKSTSGMLAG